MQRKYHKTAERGPYVGPQTGHHFGLFPPCVMYHCNRMSTPVCVEYTKQRLYGWGVWPCSSLPAFSDQQVSVVSGQTQAQRKSNALHLGPKPAAHFAVFHLHRTMGGF